MKKWQVILDLLVDVSQYLNKDVSEQTTNKKNNSREEIEVEEEEQDTADLDDIREVIRQHERLKKDSDSEVKKMNDFINNLLGADDDDE